MTYIIVDSRGWVEECGDDASDRGERLPDTHAYTDINGIKVVKTGNHWDLIVPYDIDENKAYFLLYVKYSTGDSLHTESGNICYVDLYETREAAERNGVTIMKHHEIWKDPAAHRSRRKEKIIVDTYGDQSSVRIENCAGDRIKFGTPWQGYFENIEEVIVKAVRTV